MNKLVVIGGGGNAKVLISILKRLNTFNIIGYTDKKNNGNILGVGYLGEDSVLESILNREGKCNAIIGIGQVNVSAARENIANNLLKLGFNLPAIVSDKAIVNEEVSLGKGTLVYDGVIINSGAEVGDFCLINTGSIVEHDCRIGNFVHLASGAVLGGGVKVGNGSMIGLGSRVIQYREITAGCLVGAGTVVTADCTQSGTYVGIPAKKIK